MFRRLGRLWNQFRAWRGDYFWLPCPLCGEKFGGHEWEAWGFPILLKTPLRGKGVCRACGPEADRRNKKLLSDARPTHATCDCARRLPEGHKAG